MLGASTILLATPCALGYALGSRRRASDRRWANAAVAVTLLESLALAVGIVAWGYNSLWW